MLKHSTTRPFFVCFSKHSEMKSPDISGAGENSVNSLRNMASLRYKKIYALLVTRIHAFVYSSILTAFSSIKVHGYKKLVSSTSQLILKNTGEHSGTRRAGVVAPPCVKREQLLGDLPRSAGIQSLFFFASNSQD